MNFNIQDLASYIARDLRLHIWTMVGIVFLGLVLLIALSEYRKKRILLKGTEAALDSTNRLFLRAADENGLWRRLFGPFPSLYENSPELESGHDHNSNTIAIDLDGVILEYVTPWSGINHFGKPIPGAACAIKRLRDLGYKIVIYTTRNNRMAACNRAHNTLELTALVQNQLEKSGIPYDFIALFKPMARYYIDDRAIRFENWGQTLDDIHMHETEVYRRRINNLGDAAFRPIVETDSGYTQFVDPRHG